jgi:hypothetical protein
VKKSRIVLLTGLVLGGLAWPGLAQSVIRDIGAELAVIRKSTAKYHQPEAAEADGYMFYAEGQNPDGPDALYLNWAAVYDGPTDTGVPGVLRLDQPEMLGYIEQPDGSLRLASVFFLKPYAPFPSPENPPPLLPNEPQPVWLGHEPVANENYGIWEMEVWLWYHNPDGIFEFFNPRLLKH